jgi:hypothetical protein
VYAREETRQVDVQGIFPRAEFIKWSRAHLQFKDAIGFSGQALVSMIVPKGLTSVTFLCRLRAPSRA